MKRERYTRSILRAALQGCITTLVMACVWLAFTCVARADGGASCEQKLWQEVSKSRTDVVLFRVGDRALIEVKGCAKGDCPHVFFGAKADALPTKGGVYFDKVDARPTAISCGDGSSLQYVVATPNKAVTPACVAAAEKQPSFEIFVLSRKDELPRVAVQRCAEGKECRFSTLSSDDGNAAGVVLLTACGMKKVSGTGVLRSEVAPPKREDDEKVARIVNTTDPYEVVKAWRTTPLGVLDNRNNVVLPQGGLGFDAVAVATEALQILGQIVVDRASDAAYRQLQGQVSKALQCPDVPLKTDTSKFPRTCRLLATLRVQDLASSRVALVVAVSADVLTELAKKMPKGGQAVEQVLSQVVNDSLIAQLAAIHQGRMSSAPDGIAALVGEVSLDVLGTQDAHGELCKEQRRQVVAVAGVANVQCRAAVLSKEIKTLDACPVEDFASRLAASDKLCKKAGDTKLSPEGIALSRLIASNLLKAQTATIGDGKVDVRGRVKYAVEAAFDSSCLFLGAASALQRCPAELEHVTGTPVTNVEIASLIRTLIVAVVDGDTNTVIGAASKGVTLLIEAQDSWWPALAEKTTTNSAGAEDEEKAKAARKAVLRGLRLIGGLLQYAETYTAASGEKDKDAQHAARTKILESLTREMTNRQGREQDNIWSLGGSLRLMGGARLDLAGRNNPTPWGPVSLPMGFGYQGKRASIDDVGLHLELSIIDLGQYVSFQDSKQGIQVREPEPEDLLSPSVTLGGYIGSDVPFFLGLTLGYSPSFEFQTDTSRPVGAVNVGLTAGAYVPLFDLN